MGDLPAGRSCYVEYVGNLGEWHERVILGHIQDNVYVVCTPTFDVFPEELEPNAWNNAVRYTTADGVLPAGIDPAEVFGFDPISAVDRARLLEEGAIMALQVKRQRGIAVGPNRLVGAVAAPVLPFAAATAALVPPATAVIAGAAGAWVVDEPGSEVEIGDEYGLPARAAVVGDRALVQIGGEVTVMRFLNAGADVTAYVKARRELLAEDDRILAPKSSGRRTLAEAVGEMVEVPTPDGAPRPITGPRTAAEWLSTVVVQGHTSLVSRHNRWVGECGLKHNDRLVYEHEVISRTLDTAISWDNSNIKNLWSCEMLLRRLQLLEHAVAEDPTNPSYEGASHFMGSTDMAGGGYIAPSLQSFVANELGKTTAILKEKRKAREAKAARAKGKAGGKGKTGDGPSGS